MRKESNCGECHKLFDYDDTQRTGKWCSNKCQQTNQYKQYIERWKAGLETGYSGLYDLSAYIRRYLFEKNNSKCCQCRWGEVNPKTGKIPLHVDHCDGDSRNNAEYNLRLLCPNCHSLTPNFGVLNKGKGRYSRSNTKHPKHKTVP
jgi:hypothetical protein